MAADDEIPNALAIVRRVLLGRQVTRVLLDYAVTLEFSSYDLPTVELSFEEPFTVSAREAQDSLVLHEDPASAATAWRLLMQVIGDVDIRQDFSLVVRFENGVTAVAPAGEHESWSVVGGQDRVICLARSGGLAYWS